MTNKIKLSFKNTEITAEILDTPTAKALYDTLPITAEVGTWGEEVYFPAPVEVETDEFAKNIVEPGEISYWAQGKCIAIGFGRTPISRGDEIRLAALTNIWAKAIDDVKLLGSVKDGDKVTVSKL